MNLKHRELPGKGTITAKRGHLYFPKEMPAPLAALHFYAAVKELPFYGFEIEYSGNKRGNPHFSRFGMNISYPTGGCSSGHARYLVATLEPEKISAELLLTPRDIERKSGGRMKMEMDRKILHKVLEDYLK